jgi:hypothetical protein
MPKRVLKGKLYTKRRIGRPSSRWTDDVTEDQRKMGIRGWTGKARNRDKWRLIVKEAKAHPGLYRRRRYRSTMPSTLNETTAELVQFCFKWPILQKY